MIKRAFRTMIPGILAICATVIFPQHGQVKAADAEWGCQILLCAASENPSWHGVPYCVPPMKQLITAMAKPNFSWPICSAAGTGKPGYQPYGDCPAGYEPSSESSDNRMLWSELERCIKRANCAWPLSKDDCKDDVIARPLREKPYYFDIPQASGETKQVWFDLAE